MRNTCVWVVFCFSLGLKYRQSNTVPAQICHRRLVCQACVPLSPLCLPYSPFVSSSVSLLLPVAAAAAWLGLLFCSTAESSWVLLFWQECESVWLPKSLSGDLGGQSPKIWFRTSFGPRSHLVRTSLKLQPVKTQPGEVLERLCNGLLLGLLLLLLLLVLLLLGKARFLGREPTDLWKGWKLCGRNQKHKKMTWKKKVDPISGVPWGSGFQGWLAWSRIYHRNHRNVTSIASRFVCWKCHESWCAMRRMLVLTVQTGIWLSTFG